MGRFANSLDLAKQSWGVLVSDKELAVIPVVSFIGATAVTGVFGGAAYFSLDTTKTAAGAEEMAATPVTYAVGVVGYLAVTFVVTFFAAALVAGALERFRGGDPSVSSSLSVAGSRIGPIFLWSMLTGTVGLVLQAIEQRAGFIGVIVTRAVGMAWQIVTWLAVPVIVDQGTGPFVSLKASAGLFKKTWGENLISQAGIGLVGFLAMLPGIVVGIALIAVLPVLGVVVLVLWVALVSTIVAALNGILRTAVYLFATGQQVPQFRTESLAGAFRTK